MSKKKRSPNYARNKGLSFERDVAILLRPIFPNAKRHLEFQKEEAKGVDLDHTGEFKIQCKKYAKYVPVNTIEEVQYNELVGEVPVLITAGTNMPAMAVLPLEDFINLVKNSRSLPQVDIEDEYEYIE